MGIIRPFQAGDAPPEASGHERPLKNNDERIPTPKKAIRSYCLFHCTEKGRIGSKRDLTECPHIKCPLFPYRTGQLKGRRGAYTEKGKQAKIQRLEQARKWLHSAEKKVSAARDEVAARKRKGEDIIRRMEEEHKEAVRCQENINRGRVDTALNHLKQAEDHVEYRMRFLRDLEERFNDELQRGLWGTDESLVDVLVESEEE